MKLKNLFWTAAGVSAGAFAYGALVEVNRLRPERRILRLHGWPERLNGFRIGLIADMHLRDEGTVELSQRAICWLIEQQPDMVAMVGDYVSRWKCDTASMLEEVLAPLAVMGGDVVAVPGNRDYLNGDPSMLAPIFSAYGIRLLRNELCAMHGINWAGIDSANAQEADPFSTLMQVDNPDPIIALWHEPDLVSWLPQGPALMLSGHSHGGQFTTPWGWAPVRSSNGHRYLRGFYPHAATPLYVSRGLGTTGPPARLFCPPEVTVLTLVRA